jgi:hypothetical protein
MPVVVPSAAPVTGATTDATSFDGRIRAIDDPAFGGVRIKLDYSVDLTSWSNPFQCTVYRQHKDGSVYTVRGGDPYLNYAAKGWLYDAEAPLGQPVSYYAVPIAADRTTGVQSASASIVTSAPAGGYQHPDMWLVNLEDPSSSVQARGTSTLSGNYNGRNDKQTILGSPYPAVTPDARSGLGTSVSVLTAGPTEFAAMQTLLKQNVIMRKSSLWERPDGYFTVDDVSYTAQASGTGRGLYVWQLGMVEVGRPNTYGQTVSSPAFTFAKALQQAPVFSAVQPMPFDAVQGGNLMDPGTSDGEISSPQPSGWKAFNGNSTVALVGTFAFRGTRSRQVTAGVSGPFGAESIPQFAVTPGKPYTLSVWMYSDNGLTADLQFRWLTGAGGFIASDSLSEWGLQVPLTPGTWTKVSLTATPPAGTALTAVDALATATAPGQFIYMDVAALENI